MYSEINNHTNLEIKKSNGVIIGFLFVLVSVLILIFVIHYLSSGSLCERITDIFNNMEAETKITELNPY